MNFHTYPDGLDLNWLKQSDGENLKYHFGISADELDNTLTDWQLEKYLKVIFLKNTFPPHQNYAAKLIQNATVVAQFVLITDQIHAGIADFIYN